MVEDASLDDFLDAGDESEDERDGDTSSGDDTGETERETSDSEAPTDAVERADAEASTDAVEPAVTTYAWSPSGTACAECGEVVERRWSQDGFLVCGACKRW